MKTPRLFSILLLFLTACSFSIADFISPPTATPARPAGPPTRTPPPSKTPTITATLPTPTFTDTPTLISFGPTQTASNTPTETSRIPVLVTPGTSTPPPGDTGFASVLLSVTHIYWGVCDPNQVTFTAQVVDAEQVFSVVLFVRLKDQKSTDTTDWNTGIAMNGKGNGTFTYTLKAKSIDGYNSYLNAWVYYQLVATDAGNNVLGRTPVYPQTLALSPCA